MKKMSVLALMCFSWFAYMQDEDFSDPPGLKKRLPNTKQIDSFPEEEIVIGKGSQEIRLTKNEIAFLKKFFQRKKCFLSPFHSKM